MAEDRTTTSGVALNLYAYGWRGVDGEILRRGCQLNG